MVDISTDRYRPPSPPSFTSEPIRPQRIDAGWRIISGALAMMIGATGLIACLGYSPTDPSWNSAGPHAITNPLGSLGAIVADLGMQLLGYASVAFAAMLLLAGCRRMLFLGTPNARMWATGAGAGACLMLALAAAPRPEGWQLASDMGGMIGDALMWVLSWPFEALGLPGIDFLIGFAAFAAAVVLGAAALGLRREQADAALELAQKAAVGVTRAGEAVAPPLARGAVGVARLGWTLGKLLWPKSSPLARSQDGRERGAGSARPGVDGAELGPLFPTDFLDQPGEGADPVAATGPDLFDVRSPRVAGTSASPATVPAREAASVAPAAGKRSPAQTDRAIRPAASKPRRSNGFELPPVEILSKPTARRDDIDEAELYSRSERLTEVLADYGIKGQVSQVHPGPVVTQFEFEPAAGVRVQRVIALAEDIARSMLAESARVAVMKGVNAVGIELPNRTRETVYLRRLLTSDAFTRASSQLPLALGETIAGEPFVADLARMPHLLIAGTTGSGKSVGINAMILSLLYRFTPDECRFIMIDPKRLELSVYEGIPHLLSPVVIDPKKAVVALKWVVREMEDRYTRMAQLGVRNIGGYNQHMQDSLSRGVKLRFQVVSGVDEITGELLHEMREQEPEPLPFIVVVIDEMADLMAVAGKEVEGLVQRIVQMARAAGIHVITATQRPSVDVITGTIKANFPTRISYMVRSRIDSRTILDEMGAEQLLGNGDLLYMATGGQTLRLHGPYVSDNEVKYITDHLRAQSGPRYVGSVLEEAEEADSRGGDAAAEGAGEGDLYQQALTIIRREKRISISYLQRRLSIGYNRAAKLIERMEREGRISPPDSTGRRELLDPDEPPGNDPLD